MWGAVFETSWRWLILWGHDIQRQMANAKFRASCHTSLRVVSSMFEPPNHRQSHSNKLLGGAGPKQLMILAPATAPRSKRPLQNKFVVNLFVSKKTFFEKGKREKGKGKRDQRTTRWTWPTQRNCQRLTSGSLVKRKPLSIWSSSQHSSSLHQTQDTRHKTRTQLYALYCMHAWHTWHTYTGLEHLFAPDRSTGSERTSFTRYILGGAWRRTGLVSLLLFRSWLSFLVWSSQVNKYGVGGVWLLAKERKKKTWHSFFFPLCVWSPWASTDGSAMGDAIFLQLVGLSSNVGKLKDSLCELTYMSAGLLQCSPLEIMRSHRDISLAWRMCDDNGTACGGLNVTTATTVGTNLTNSTGFIADDFSALIAPLLVVDVTIIVILVLAVVAQWWRVQKYNKYNTIKKLQLRFVRQRQLTKEAKKFFGNLSVRASYSTVCVASEPVKMWLMVLVLFLV